MQNASRIRLEEMIARTAIGDRGAFAALYEATSPKLYAICMSVLKDRPETEETLQEVYIKIWQAADRYASNGLSPMTWLITIARNRAIDRLRARASRPAISTTDETASLISPELGPEAATIRAQERRLLDECLGQLGKDKANAIRAVYLEGITYTDLAARVETPINTVRSWVRRSLLKLRDCVKQ